MRGEMLKTLSLRIISPLIVLVLLLGLWEYSVQAHHIPLYILPAPHVILRTLIDDYALLLSSLVVTLKTTLIGFLLASGAAIVTAMLLIQTRWLEAAFYPYMVMLQVTPVVAIAPLLIIYLPQEAAILTSAVIVAFFPVLSNVMFGLRQIDPRLEDVFRLYRASRWQILWRLRWPSAVPFLMDGLKISGGLALIGAVVAEIAAGTAGFGSGIAYRIIESQYRLNVPRLFAALLLLLMAGTMIFIILSLFSRLFARFSRSKSV
jgi:NitT/TauT family transport system permease protein